MTASTTGPEIKGWCPGALRPMMSGDGLVVRVRLPAGRMTKEQACSIASLSTRFGNGLIDFSSRANVQLRGVKDDAHAALIDGLRSSGLIDPSAAVEARRNIVVTPFWTDGDGIAALARSLGEALAQSDAPQTPGKFGYAVDCGPDAVLRETSADIRIERGVSGGLIVRADGARHGAPVTFATVVPMALHLARWFLETGGAPEGRGRMAAHLARGAKLPGEFLAEPARNQAEPPPLPGPVALGFLVGIEFGQMRAEGLSELASLGPLRTTPWRMLLVEGANTVPATASLITNADDPRLGIIACTGAPSCPQALAETRSLARVLSQTLPPGRTLHISGCAKGCAHPGPATVTLVARKGGTFDLIRGGRATDTPVLFSLKPESLPNTLLTE